MTEDGFYWLTLKGWSKPDIVEINGNGRYRCGTDCVFFKEDGIWQDAFEPLDIVSLVGPLQPPDA